MSLTDRQCDQAQQYSRALLDASLISCRVIIEADSDDAAALALSVVVLGNAYAQAIARTIGPCADRARVHAGLRQAQIALRESTLLFLDFADQGAAPHAGRPQ